MHNQNLVNLITLLLLGLSICVGLLAVLFLLGVLRPQSVRRGSETVRTLPGRCLLVGLLALLVCIAGLAVLQVARTAGRIAGAGIGAGVRLLATDRIGDARAQHRRTGPDGVDGEEPRLRRDGGDVRRGAAARDRFPTRCWSGDSVGGRDDQPRRRDQHPVPMLDTTADSGRLSVTAEEFGRDQLAARMLLGSWRAASASAAAARTSALVSHMA